MTALELANKALLRIGVAPLSSFADTTDVAQNVTSIFAPTMNVLVAEGDWNFAKARAVLAENTTVTNLTEYEVAYDVPADAVEIISMQPAEVPYHIEAGILYTNAEPRPAQSLPRVLYRRIAAEEVSGEPQLVTGVTPSLLFENAFVARLASELAVKLRGSAQLAAQLQQEAQYYVRVANAQALGESPGNQAETFTFLGESV